MAIARYVVGLIAASAVATSVLVSPAAQAADARDPADGEGLQEIVVTAEKRETSLQKTAISMTAFDQEALLRNGVTKAEDIAALAPGVELAQNSANIIVTIRGVASRDTTEIGDPAVAISTDGFYIQRPYGLSDSTYDLERVEVLRGPQGTLYGRNATGGAINFISNKPKDDFEASGTIGYGTYNLLTTQGMVNVPLTDKLDARASFSTIRHDGYRSGEAPATPGDDADATSARVHLLYKPIDDLKILLTGQFTHEGGVGPTVEGFAPLQKVNGATVTSYQPSIYASGVPHGAPNQRLDDTIKTIQWDIEYNLGFANLVYIGGHRNTNFRQLRDLDGVLTSGNYFLPNERPQDWSHELRLVSNGAGPFTWQVGAYYFTEDNPLYTLYQSYAVANSPTNIFTYNTDTKQNAKAGYGQVTYEILDGVKLEGGLRYSTDHKDRYGYQDLGAGPVSQQGSSHDSKTTYHAAIDWQAAPANLLYVKYDTGYKAGGFAAPPGLPQHLYAPETVSAVEAGSKNRFLNNRLQLNISAFHYNYEDQQVAVLVTSGSSAGFSDTLNAGQSKIWGTEIEAAANVTSADKVDAFVDYLHAVFSDFCTARTNGVCTKNLAGHTAAQAPLWQLGGGYEHEFPFGNGASFNARVQSHFETHTYLGPENYGYQYQKQYSRSDVLLTFHAPQDKWSLQGYVRNLENAVVITSAGAGFGYYNYALAPPRTYGVQFTYNK
jgi:iron complex outermembrane recepter protein